MKKTIFYLSMAVLAMSCVKENNPEGNAPEAQLVPMEFETTVETTKTALGEDGKTVLWKQGDEVAVFDGTAEKKKFVAQSEGAVTTLAGEAAAAEEYYAVYPYNATRDESGVFTVTVNAQQNAVAGSMAEKSAVIVAKAEGNSFSFKNVSSLVKFSLAVEGVKSLTLVGNNNEAIAGKFTFEWNGGDPAFKEFSAPKATVTLTNAEGSDLAQGDYYFAIVPTNFEKGFSVILGMNDGTQKVVSRSAGLDLKKGQIFRSQAVPANAYKACTSNFVKYNDGFDLTYGGVTINKSAAGAATYVNDGVATISAGGVYFVAPEAANVNLAVLGTTGLVVAGDNPEVRSKVFPSKAIQPQEKADGYIVLSDLELVNSTSLAQFILQQTENKGGFANFGSIVVNNCKINTVTGHFIACNNRDMKLDHLVVENSDFLMNITTAESTVGAYIFNSGGKVSTINNAVFHNNVFQNVASASTLNRFRLINAENKNVGSTLKEVTVTNNTLVGMVLNQHGYVRAQIFDGYIKMQDNFFVESHPAATNIQLLNAVTLSDNMSCEVKNNFYYTTGMTKGLQCSNITAQDGMTRTAINPVAFTTYPLSADWDPANGVFGYVSGLKYGSLATTGVITEKGDVAAYRGAQRKTSAAVVNKAGAGYTSENLGNL